MRGTITEAIVRAVWTIAKAVIWLLRLLVMVFWMTLEMTSHRLGTGGFIEGFLACVLLTYAFYRNVPIAFAAAGIMTPIVWHLTIIGLVGT
jgi:hypothetical protein